MPVRTFTVRGMKVRSASQRRFVVVVVRPEDFIVDDGVYPAFARIERRSDSAATCRTVARRMRDNGCRGHGLIVTVVDSVTGEELS